MYSSYERYSAFHSLSYILLHVSFLYASPHFHVNFVNVNVDRTLKERQLKQEQSSIYRLSTVIPSLSIYQDKKLVLASENIFKLVF